VKTPPINHRVWIKRASGFPVSTSHLTVEQRAALDGEERLLDQEFARFFTNEELVKRWKTLSALLRARGTSWEIAEKETGFESDRISAAAVDAYRAFDSLAEEISKATPSTLRLMRLAFEAGAFETESKAYLLKALGRGAPRKVEEMHRQLDAAYSKWKKANPRATREPTAPQLEKFFVGSGRLTDYGSPENFANHVSKWRKVQRNRIAEKRVNK
jgi:hypothetical protein